MENKINIAELLKDCPTGMELDCTTWENITFEKVIGNTIYIKRNSKSPSFDKIVILNQYGCCTGHQDEKCRIFPKGKTTWEGFQRPFKDGDVVVAEDSKLFQLFLLKQLTRRRNDNTYYGDCYFGWDFQNDKLFKKRNWSFDRLATDEEKKKLFDVIKANGYKWNSETKTLETLIKPKFKVGDRVKSKINQYEYTIVDIRKDVYIINYATNEYGYHVPFCNEDNFELISNKFDINTLIPFESRVLVRDYDNQIWIPTFFGKYLEDDSNCRYLTTNGCYKYCIPYECNQHLLGNTDNCNDFYKTWINE